MELEFLKLNVDFIDSIISNKWELLDSRLMILK